MKFLLSVLFVMAAVSKSMACLPDPSGGAKLKNQLVVTVLNSYGADITQSQFKVTGFQHQYEWKFTDPGFQCHDTDHASAVVQLSYQDSWSGSSCRVTVQVSQVSGPNHKTGNYEVDTNMEVLSPRVCYVAEPHEAKYR